MAAAFSPLDKVMIACACGTGEGNSATSALPGIPPNQFPLEFHSALLFPSVQVLVAAGAGDIPVGSNNPAVAPVAAHRIPIAHRRKILLRRGMNPSCTS